MNDTLDALARAHDAERAAQDKLRRTEEGAAQAQKMEAVGRLAGGVAHDFNNLLTVVSMHSDVVLADERLPPDLREDVVEMRKAAERGASLTHQLLALGRKQVVQRTALDLDEVVRDLCKMLGRVIGEDVDLTVDLGGAGTVLADRGQLHQILLNLVLNARDAMPAGGRLVVRTGRSHLEDEASAGGDAGTWATLAVSDDGGGMDAGTREKAFEPFFTTKARGTGLGLATVFGIVTQSGGQIEIDSEPGRGTTVAMRFPSLELHAEATSERHRPGAQSGTESILVVEDEEHIRRLVGDALRRRGYRVTEAKDGREAIEVFARRNDVDLVVSDVVMPRMGGRDLRRWMAEHRPDAKALLISGYTDADDFEDVLRIPGTAFLQKPFRPDELARRARELLDTRA